MLLLHWRLANPDVTTLHGHNPIAKTTFAAANQNCDYRVFEDFAFFMKDQARMKRVTDIFKMKRNVYA